MMPKPAPDADTAVDALIELRRARLAVELHGDLAQAVRDAVRRAEASDRARAESEAALRDARADLDAANREIHRLNLVINPPPPERPPEPARVTCPSCHTVVAIVGRDAVPAHCPVCQAPVESGG